MVDKELDASNPIMVEFFKICESDVKVKSKIAAWRAAIVLVENVPEIKEATDSDFIKVMKTCCVQKNFVMKSHAIYVKAMTAVEENDNNKLSENNSDNKDSESSGRQSSQDNVMTDSTNVSKTERISKRKRSVAKRFDEECFDEPSGVKKPKSSGQGSGPEENSLEAESSADETESVLEDSMSLNVEKETSPIVDKEGEELIIDGRNVLPIIEEITGNSKSYTGERLVNLRKCIKIALSSEKEVKLTTIAKSYNIPAVTFKKFFNQVQSAIKDVGGTISEVPEDSILQESKGDETILVEENSTNEEIKNKEKEKSVENDKEEKTIKSSKAENNEELVHNQESLVEITPSKPCPYIAANTALPSYILEDLDRGQTHFSVNLYPRQGGKTRMEISKLIESSMNVLEKFESDLLKYDKDVIQEAVDMVLMDGRSAEYASCANGLPFADFTGLCSMIHSELVKSPQDVADLNLTKIFFRNPELEVLRQRLIKSLIEHFDEQKNESIDALLYCTDVLIDCVTPVQVSYDRKVKLEDVDKTVKKVSKAWNSDEVLQNSKISPENESIVQRWQSRYKKI